MDSAKQKQPGRGSITMTVLRAKKRGRWGCEAPSPGETCSALTGGHRSQGQTNQSQPRVVLLPHRKPEPTPRSLGQLSCPCSEDALWGRSCPESLGFSLPLHLVPSPSNTLQTSNSFFFFFSFFSVTLDIWKFPAPRGQIGPVTAVTATRHPAASVTHTTAHTKARS